MTSVVVMGALLYQNYYNCRVGNRGIDDRGIDDRSIDDRDRDRGLTTTYLIHIKITKYGQISMKYTNNPRIKACVVW